MTDYQKQKIKNMRLKGDGYKAIATKLGLSRDTVRQYCKRNNLMGVADVVKLNYEVQIESGIICRYCNSQIKHPSRGRKKKFCSDKCRKTWWAKNYGQHLFGEEKIYKFICKGCGKEFESYSNRKRLYCGHGCYIAARFKNEGNEIND